MLRQVEHDLQAIRSPEAAACPFCEGIVNAELTHQSVDIAVLVPKPAAYTQHNATRQCMLNNLKLWLQGQL